MTPCIEASGRRDEHGYVHLPGELRAHRVALAEKLGRQIAPGMFACHKCDNPPCVNPDHLFEGTSTDNNRDRHAKGRSRGLFASGSSHPATQRSGERHWRAKLSTAQVVALRVRSAAGESRETLGAEFGVNPATVSRIARGIWRREVTA